ncbi:hypothetical protein HY642_07395, partial [Candidatus Woesearchaeota archaeon]|nr:hypothetical protein [Candidatus Woesearchaeota archaeon]
MLWKKGQEKAALAILGVVAVVAVVGMVLLYNNSGATGAAGTQSPSVRQDAFKECTNLRTGEVRYSDCNAADMPDNQWQCFSKGCPPKGGGGGQCPVNDGSLCKKIICPAPSQFNCENGVSSCVTCPGGGGGGGGQCASDCQYR